ncbi:MAG: thiamine pyrophosphate-dependent enzyme [Bdellovibrionota bacterium]|nr:2-oxoglutarate ferredoxin oxidoreductase subunit beta [Pseudobdellovibrionaceae bacterium]|tara:strand:+ start:3547 stop:4569 length:1023 start_codon:yes stop_codon:yes gene_type:complete
MAKENAIGLEKAAYKGGKSTLCTGCGHDSITNHIQTAYFQANVNPFDIAKLSGIGCSSKTPAYFMSKSHGFNSLHGRLGPLATGVYSANKDLKLIGISGDGDTASIGFGGFAHLIRRNVPMVYLCYNNGVYGLTKGQFSATAEMEAVLKTGAVNPFQEVDLCAMALQLGCGFVARSFSGDAKQLVPLIQAAIHHNGTAFIDVISPCITFNNHEQSSKSFVAVKDHKVNLQELGVIETQDEIKVDYEEGELQMVDLPDGTQIYLRKLDSRAHNVNDKFAAMRLLETSTQSQELLTGLLYINEKNQSLGDKLNITETPIRKLDLASIKPSNEKLKNLMKDFS